MPPESLFAAGEARYWRSEFDSARALWRAELAHADSAADSVARARVLTWLGLAAWQLGDYPEARRLGEAALALKRRLGLASELSRSYNALGLLAWNEGRLFDARTLFDSAAAAAERVEDSESAAKAAGNLALVRTELGDFVGARRGFERMRAAGRALGQPRIEANALTNLAMLEIRLGDPAAALPLLGDARRLYRAADYARGEQSALGQLGTAYAALGELQLALAALDSALRLSRAQELRQEVAANLEVLADLHAETGNYRRALALLAEADSIDAELGLAVERGTNLRRSAEILAEMGRPKEAVGRASLAVRAHRSTGAGHEEVRSRLLLAELQAQIGDGEAAAREMAAARGLARTLGSRSVSLELAVAEARLALVGRDFARAIADLDRADRAAASSDWRVHHLRAAALQGLGRLAEARRSAETAVARVERVRARIGRSSLRTTLLSARTEVYARLVNILLEAGDVGAAFDAADAVKGRALQEYLLIGSSTGRPERAGLARLVEGEALLRRVRALEARLEEVEADQEGDALARRRVGDHLARELERARSEYEELLVTGAGATEEDGLVAGGMGSASRTRAALDTDEALLAYFVGPEGTRLFVATNRGLEQHTIPLAAAALEAKLRLVRQALSERPMRQEHARRLLAGLGEDLIGPASRSGSLGGVRRLLVVPHGALAAAPFPALVNPASGRHVVEDFFLLQLPSAAALHVLRSRTPRGGTAKEAAVFAPFPDALPASAREAGAVARLLGAARVVGSRATERRVREALARGAVVHLASHGELNPSNPMFSRVALARGEGGTSADDGALELHEVLGLTTSSPLVFLSGCETALGASGSDPIHPGEDHATLARAFLYAGAGHVVGTLWRVDDRSAEQVAGRFYQALRRLPAPEALAEAQRALLRAGGAMEWAAYVVSGAGDAGSAQNRVTGSVP